MEEQAYLFKDDTLNGIFLAIQNLQHQESETKANNPNAPHEITKYNPLFRNLINYLDLIFSFGLKDAKKGYWPFVRKMAHSSVTEMVEQHKYATSEVKKGYIWLFLTFIENSLEGYLRMMVSNTKLLRFFYKNYALLRDTERREILFNLLIGLEAFNFSINFDEPYLDFGHDPVLRQEKVVIRVHSTALKKETAKDVTAVSSRQPDVTIHQPDVTIHEQGVKVSRFPDLLEAQQNLLLSKPTSSSPKHTRRHSLDGHKAQDLDMDLVEHVSTKRRGLDTKTRSISEGADQNEVEEAISNGSLELAEDNYIPEMIGSPEYALCLPEEEAEILMHDGSDVSDSRSRASQKSDPMMKSYSENERGYQLFLEDYQNQDKVIHRDSIDELEGDDEVEESGELNETNVVLLTHEEDDVEHEDLFTPITPVVDKIQKLGLCDSEGYHLTYVSDGEDEDIGIPRTDSFDRFCRRNSTDSSTSRGEGSPIHQLQRSGSTPSHVSQISGDQLEEEKMNMQSVSMFEITPSNITQIPRSASVSRLSANRMSESRHDMRIGFLLPTLPRRPDLKEATYRSEEIILDQSEQVLLTLEIFHQPTELPVKMFKVHIGCLVGLDYIMYLLVSTMSVYLLDKREAVHAGYVSMKCISIDCINKVQTGLNFQDVYISHDYGCFHVSTADEITTRAILLTVKNVIRSNSGVGIEKEQPMAANTNNELDLITQDWLICHTRVEEPEILHFVLMQFSVLTPQEKKNKVLKSGYVDCRHFLVAGVKTSWDKAFFTLRGHMLYKYSSTGTEVKNVYDLSKKCGGCIHSGTDGERYTFKLLGDDGSTPVVELGVDNENEANDWLMTICQVVADAKNDTGDPSTTSNSLINCGLVLTPEKIYFFNQDPKSGRLALEDSFCVADITQVCVDNENRTYCTLVLDQYVDENSSSESSKVTWLLNFHSEFELGKFEQKLYDTWQSMYQVPLQFVLLSDVKLKRKIESLFNRHTKEGLEVEMGTKLLDELVDN